MKANFRRFVFALSFELSTRLSSFGCFLFRSQWTVRHSDSPRARADPTRPPSAAPRCKRRSWSLRTWTSSCTLTSTACRTSIHSMRAAGCCSRPATTGRLSCCRAPSRAAHWRPSSHRASHTSPPPTAPTSARQRPNSLLAAASRAVAPLSFRTMPTASHLQPAQRCRSAPPLHPEAG